jgi:hypothetical protein
MFMIYSDFTNFVRFNPALNYALKKRGGKYGPPFFILSFSPFSSFRPIVCLGLLGIGSLKQ